MRKHFRDLFEYNAWANDRLLITMEENRIADEHILQIYGHLISAQFIWLLRIRGLPTTPFPLWEKYKITELRSMTDESDRNWRNYIDTHKMETFEEMVFYTNAQGKKYESTIRQIMNQVLNHSTYHRAQVALLLRQKGMEPPMTDYIFYKRTH